MQHVRTNTQNTRRLTRAALGSPFLAGVLALTLWTVTGGASKLPRVQEADASEVSPRSQSVLGHWHDEYRGQRHLTIRDDGTATMVVEPDSLGKMLFADKLTFHIEWQIRGDRLIMKTVGGEPEGKTKLITKIYGDRAEHQIRDVTADRMLLLDSDGKTHYDWRRPE